MCRLHEAAGAPEIVLGQEEYYRGGEAGEETGGRWDMDEEKRILKRERADECLSLVTEFSHRV